jgi:hypothetical protein
MKVADGIKVSPWLSLRWGDFPVLSWWVQYDHQDPKTAKGIWRVRESAVAVKARSE